MDYNKALRILGLSENYSEEDLKKNYKELAKKYHPDNSPTGDEGRFYEVKTAYDYVKAGQENKDQTASSGQRSSGGGGTEVCPMCNGMGWRREKVKTFRGFVAQKVTCKSCNGTGKK